MSDAQTSWPALAFEEWRDTYETLHMWMQVVGKICLALTPPVNHYWNVAFHVTSRGIATPPLTSGGRALDFTFDFIDHRLVVATSDGAALSLPLVARSVADFYGDVLRLLGDLEVPVKIWPMPVEVPNPVPFPQDVVHASYVPAQAHQAWRVLVQADQVLREFRARFIGKCSPVHFFWGSFDLAVTRFSGRRAPERPDADRITKESYSHEVISHGFWPGNASLPMPVFYAYSAPEPAGFSGASVEPAKAFYSREFSEFLLPYDAVRASNSPRDTVMAFLDSTYEAAATLANWDREHLERPAVFAGTRRGR